MPPVVRILSATMLPLESYQPSNMPTVKARLAMEILSIDPRDSRAKFSWNGAPAVDELVLNVPKRTRFDIDARHSSVQRGEAVEVTVSIKDNFGSFIPDWRAISAGSPEAATIMRHLTIIDDKTVTFLCVKQDPPLGAVAFNIGVLIRELQGDPNFEMPVILDPKVQNDS